MKRLLEYLIALISIAFMLWIGFSFIDVITDNTTTAQHASWNAFVMLTKTLE